MDSRFHGNDIEEAGITDGCGNKLFVTRKILEEIQKEGTLN